MVVLGYIVQLGEHPVFAIDTALSQMEILHISIMRHDSCMES